MSDPIQPPQRPEGEKAPRTDFSRMAGRIRVVKPVQPEKRVPEEVSPQVQPQARLAPPSRSRWILLGVLPLLLIALAVVAIQFSGIRNVDTEGEAPQVQPASPRPELPGGPSEVAPVAPAAPVTPLAPASLRALRDRSEEALVTARRETPGHPALINRLRSMETGFQRGERELDSGSWSAAREQFETLLREAAELAGDVRNLREAERGLNGLAALFEAKPASGTFEPREQAALREEMDVLGEAFRDGRFAAVLAQLGPLETRLRAWDERRERALAGILLEGRRALANGDGPSARLAFERALDIKPGNTEATQGLRRSETIGEVQELARRAETAESAGNLEEALSLWNRAFSIDPLFGQAQQNSGRLNQLIRRNEWESGRGEARRLTDSNAFSGAIELYDQLIDRFPEFSSELIEEREAVAVRERQSRLNQMIQRGRQLESLLRWEEALDWYREGQKTFPDAPQLREGSERVAMILRANIRFRTLLQFARQAADAGNFREARNLFNEAVQAKPSVTPLGIEGEALQTLLLEQSNPVEIRITSDNRTLVSIPGYLPPEQFRTKTISILPGNYTLRGVRGGFRDVQIDLRIRAGEDVPRLHVAATERLR